jgi:uncharacterized membrane protein
MVGLAISVMLIFFVAMIPLGIGLIWAVPLISIAYGVVYRTIFGLEQAVA